METMEAINGYSLEAIIIGGTLSIWLATILFYIRSGATDIKEMRKFLTKFGKEQDVIYNSVKPQPSGNKSLYLLGNEILDAFTKNFSEFQNQLTAIKSKIGIGVISKGK